jgi:hypothetical protein
MKTHTAVGMLSRNPSLTRGMFIGYRMYYNSIVGMNINTGMGIVLEFRPPYSYFIYSGREFRTYARARARAALRTRVRKVARAPCS